MQIISELFGTHIWLFKQRAEKVRLVEGTYNQTGVMHNKGKC